MGLKKMKLKQRLHVLGCDCFKRPLWNGLIFFPFFLTQQLFIVLPNTSALSIKKCLDTQIS